jgi:hypothetical protein
MSSLIAGHVKNKLEGVKRNGGANLTNVQCKTIGNCHNEFPSVQKIYADKNEKRSNIVKMTMFPK